MKHIYAVCESYDDGVSFEHELDLLNFDYNWDELLSNEATKIELRTTKPDAFKDFFSFAGTIGVASHQLASLLADWAGPRLKLRLVFVDGRAFQILLPGEPVDVLDRTSSKYTMFKSDPTRIKLIHSFVFHSENLPPTPFAFTIPESPATLFVTEEAASTLITQGFTGIKLMHLSDYQEL